MKRLSTFLMALLLITLGANAQTTDFTWALNCGTWTGNTGTYSTGVERYGDEINVEGTEPVKVLYQTIDGLPAGTYSVTFYAAANNAWVGAAYGKDIAQVFANEVTDTITVVDRTEMNENLSTHSYTLECVVGDDGILEYGLQNIATGGNWYVCQGVSLTYSGTYVPTAGDKVYGCTAELSHWTTTGNTEIQYNTWSEETDASGMVTPFLQVWRWLEDEEQNTLEAATISHETLTDLTIGYYEVSMDIRIFSENAEEAIGSGTTFNANSVSEDLDTGSDGAEGVYGTETEVFGTYTLLVEVEDGTLDISITIPEGVTYNWLSWKNLKVTYLGETTAGYEAHECTAALSHWTQTYTGTGTAGDYALNTWSTEADASGMVTPFLQTWVYQDVLSDQTIDHNQLTGMTPGWYSVTVDARIMSESGEAITGTATLTANDDFIYLISDGSDGSYNGEAEEYGTYTVQCYVDEDGTLDIGFTIANANFNWLAWKNLSVVYLGETVAYNVGEATASETVVTPGQTVTLKFSDCTKGDEGATLGVGSSANVTFGSTAVTLTPKGTITFTFDVPDVAESGEYTLTIPANTIVWTYSNETKAGNAQQTITFTVLVPATIDEGEYLIVDAEGNYLGGGRDYGTHATSIGKPQFISFEAQENGTYHFDSHQYNNASAHYLGSNLYFDNATPVDWILVEVADGYAIYGTADTGTGYLTSNGFQELATVETTPYTWTLVTMDDIVKSMADATEDAPVDVTALIASPEMKRNSNTTYYPTWTVSTGSVTFGQNSTIGGTATANCAESWHSENGFDVNQIITLPLAGTYKLSAQAFHTGEETIVLYAGENTADLPIPTTDPADQAAAYQAFLTGTYPVGPITITTTSADQTVTIGFSGDNSSEWVVMGELDLQYLGVVEETVTWTMTDANWGTLILPFDADVPEGLTAYSGAVIELGDEDSDGNSALTIGDASTSIEANTPYLVKGNVAQDTNYTFTGTPVEAVEGLTSGLLTGTFVDMDYNDLSALESNGSTVYLLQKHDYQESSDEDAGGVGFYPVTEDSAPTDGDASTGASLDANHCYLTLPSGSSGVRAYISLPDSGDETGIVAVEGDVIANDAIYDLSGRRVSKAVKGVYIMNGKKVLVK